MGGGVVCVTSLGQSEYVVEWSGDCSVYVCCVQLRSESVDLEEVGDEFGGLSVEHDILIAHALEELTEVYPEKIYTMLGPNLD